MMQGVALEGFTEVRRDVEALQQEGVDAIMFGNEGDRPYLTKASPECLPVSLRLSAFLAR